MSAYFAGFVVRRLMKGKNADQIERAFWIVVVILASLFIAGLLADRFLTSVPLATAAPLA